jgi:O-antigen/teichoic acid export membrane protein
MKRPVGDLKSSVLQALPRQVATFRLWELSLVVGEGVLELIVNLAVMVLVERTYGQSALGIYSYLLSFYHLTAYLAEFGIPRYVERETALHSESPSDQTQVLNKAYQSVLTLALLAGGFCFLSAAYDTSHTQIQETMAAYFIIGLAIPFRNLNRLRLASLNGQGRHEEAAKLQAKKRIVFLAAVFALLTVRIVPSYLVTSFFIAELYLALAGRKKLKFPSLRSTEAGLDRLCATLREGYRLTFTDDPLEVVLYIDLLVLGIFMSAWDLGVYAEASILARFFLLIPMSLRPVFRRKYCVLIAHADHPQASRLAQQAAARLFFLHALLALAMLLFYPQTLHLVFRTGGEESLSFQIFKVFVPGILFSASVITSEPLYEALGQVDALRKLMLTIFAVNLVLNVYLIPLAGLFGAASATMISLLLHFLLLGRHLSQPYRLQKGSYLVAGSAVYVIYAVMQALDAGMLVAIWLLPVLLSLLFYGIGFFNADERLEVQPSDGGRTDGGRTEGNLRSV